MQIMQGTQDNGELALAGSCGFCAAARMNVCAVERRGGDDIKVWRNLGTIPRSWGRRFSANRHQGMDEMMTGY